MITAKNNRLQHFGPDISSWAAQVLPQPVLQSSVRVQLAGTRPSPPEKISNGSWDRQLGTIAINQIPAH
jgi:hypothetical protein